MILPGEPSWKLRPSSHRGSLLAMSDLETRRATYDDLLKVPEHMVAEIIDGGLYALPRPALRHSKTSFVLMGHLAGPFHLAVSGPGGWTFLNEPELHLRDDVVVPDIAGWRNERMVDVPDAAFADLAPDWVCEVLSPRTQKIDRSRKMGIYARDGVRHIWLIDPIEQILEVYRLQGES